MDEKQRTSIGSASVNFSEDLMIQILMRVESKSLIRFKCVCKSWNSLIGNPNFIFKHLLQNQNPNNRFIVSRREKVTRKDLISLLSSENPAEFRDLPYDLILDLEGVMNDLSVFTCNGLICLDPFYNPEIVIWNPKTNEFKVIPECDIPLDPPNVNCYTSIIGFGFDSNSKDYKVVRLVTYFYDLYPEDDDYCIQHAEVYSLRTNSWRKIESVPRCNDITFSPNETTDANGIFYWHGNTPSGAVVVSFDMSTELFHSTPLPPLDPSLIPSYSPVFFTFNERLALIEMSLNIEGCWTIYDCFDVWVLLEHGVKESWTKLFRIGPWLRNYSLLGIWKTGELFMASENGELLLYDPISHERKNLNLVGDSHSFKIVNYTETRVSLGEKKDV